MLVIYSFSIHDVKRVATNRMTILNTLLFIIAYLCLENKFFYTLFTTTFFTFFSPLVFYMSIIDTQQSNYSLGVNLIKPTKVNYLLFGIHRIKDVLLIKTKVNIPNIFRSYLIRNLLLTEVELPDLDFSTNLTTDRHLTIGVEEHFIA